MYQFTTFPVLQLVIASVKLINSLQLPSLKLETVLQAPTTDFSVPRDKQGMARRPPKDAYYAASADHYPRESRPLRSMPSQPNDQSGVILVTAGYDHTIKFWEALSGICSRTIQHPDSVIPFHTTNVSK
jgi:hypothetical protein